MISFTDFILYKYLRLPIDYAVGLGTRNQKGSLFAAVLTKPLWKEKAVVEKVKAILTRWKPSEKEIHELATKVFREEIFGTDEDYGHRLMKLYFWHNSNEWDFSFITEFDETRANALQAFTVLTTVRFREVSSSHLHLNLGQRAPSMTFLVHPMIVKIPVLSFQYYLHIDAYYTFNSIRKAKHPHGDDLVSYLYEILFIQQKIAISLHEYLRLTDYARRQKRNALLINAEVNAIMGADLVFTYLKASVEKVVVLLGLTHGITNLESKKTHKAKIDALDKGIPTNVKEKCYYWGFVFNFISSENLDELNSYRSGLLHKKGIADLQPHNYVGKDEDVTVTLLKIYSVLHEQHFINTAVLLGVLALLTDNLVSLDPPALSFSELPVDEETMMEYYKATATQQSE
ncbi:MAG: hypothetical protein JWQ09_5684 [Segetibacter sp.]|nr:hypothetical protein [Segetibacter sp.]